MIPCLKIEIWGTRGLDLLKARKADLSRSSG
jgi:hypothetical protein